MRKSEGIRSGARLLALWIAVAAYAHAAENRTRVPDTMDERVVACAACHGSADRATRDGYSPRIAGKPAGYLYNQLVNFRDGRRRNAAMTYLVGNLSDAYLDEIARHFAGRQQLYAPPQVGAVSPAVAERGRQLVTIGDAAKKIPACATCHGDALTGVAPYIPGLVGLPGAYLKAQLGAWRNGARRAAVPDCMAEIVARLDADDVSAAIAYLVSRPAANSAPASAAARSLPLECGSVPSPPGTR